MSRREFVYQSLAATAATMHALTTSNQAAADESGDIPILDTHQHLWDLEKFKLPWLGSAPAILRRSYVTQDYLDATAGLNVTRAIYMEVDVDPAQQVAEAEHLIEICQRGGSPTVAAVISGRPNSSGFRNYIGRFQDSPFIKGVRQVLHAPEAKRGLCLEPEFVRSIQLLGELSMRFDLCMRPSELSDAVQLVDQCRATQFILDHCGNADPRAFTNASSNRDERPLHEVDQWKRDISELAKRPNVTCKISGVIARVPAGSSAVEMLAPIINYCLDAFGADRVVFGGDWPVCLLGGTYRQWVEVLRQIVRERPGEVQRKLWHENATRLYGLSDSSSPGSSCW